MPRATDKVQWKGFTVDAKTAAALDWAEERAGVPISLSQGSFNLSVSASATTHAGAAACDVRTVPLNDKEQAKVLKALKDAGFAAWLRKEIPGLWGEHIHAVLLDTAGASKSAKWQCAEYLAGRDGLQGRRTDKSYRPNPQVKFDWAKKKPVPR